MSRSVNLESERVRGEGGRDGWSEIVEEMEGRREYNNSK